MEPNDKVRVKTTAIDHEYRGRTGRICSITGQTAEVEFDDEAVFHSFGLNELELLVS